MKKIRNALALLLTAVLLSAAAPVFAEEDKPQIEFLSYEEALTYFDFTTAVSRWCDNFGMDVTTRGKEAEAAILAGTDRELLIRLATYARDVGYGNEKILVNNAFRPACYQEIIGLHDSNANTGYFRNALTWNGKSVTNFWWSAEQSEGWPESCTIDFSRYDLDTVNMAYAYRWGLRLWDNTWAGGYYARPGCSGHNSGEAIDIQNWWIGANYATSYTNPLTGVTCAMADYGLYKPLQASATSSGETWHITCAPSAEAMGNFDTALSAGYEVVWGVYYNPSLRGWSMADGRGEYIGAGVLCLQLRLCQLGLLDEKYITGYFCSETDRAVKAYQEQQGLEPDGICGSGTMTQLMEERDKLSLDIPAPEVTSAEVIAQNKSGFTLALTSKDPGGVTAYRVETRRKDTDAWIPRYYNAFADGSCEAEVDLWSQGVYDVRVTAIDGGGNESALFSAGSIFADMTAPVITSVTVSDIREDGFTLRCRGRDDTAVGQWMLTLTPENGEPETIPFAHESETDILSYTAAGTEKCAVTVSCADTLGNESSYTLRWRYDPKGSGTMDGLSVTHFGA